MQYIMNKVIHIVYNILHSAWMYTHKLFRCRYIILVSYTGTITISINIYNILNL